MATPIGELRILASLRGITNVVFKDSAKAPAPAIVGDTPLLRQAVAELNAYFTGKLRTFQVALDLKGTSFQVAVWQELINIEYGSVTSYGELACSLGRPKSARPVGGANSKNPIWIIVPCHRVVGSSGRLVGYGGGVAKKQWLLAHEQLHLK